MLCVFVGALNIWVRFSSMALQPFVNEAFSFLSSERKSAIYALEI